MGMACLYVRVRNADRSRQRHPILPCPVVSAPESSDFRKHVESCWRLASAARSRHSAPFHATRLGHGPKRRRRASARVQFRLSAYQAASTLPGTRFIAFPSSTFVPTGRKPSGGSHRAGASGCRENCWPWSLYLKLTSGRDEERGVPPATRTHAMYVKMTLRVCQLLMPNTAHGMAARCRKLGPRPRAADVP